MSKKKQVTRQAVWQQKQVDNKRCASCGRQDAQTKSGGRRCAKCTENSQTTSRAYKRRTLGCGVWVKGGRGRPPINKPAVAKELNQVHSVNALALLLAGIAHKGQVRRGGEDYIMHPARVALGLPAHLRSVAFLHDAIEDHPEIVDHPAWMKLPGWVRDTVRILTRDDVSHYDSYIAGIVQSKNATIVKIADIKDNLASNPTPKQVAKYNAALPILEAALKNYAKR